MGPNSLNDLIYSGPKASYLGPFLLSLVVEPTMALYTGSDILANRGSPHFGAESPDGRLGLLMALTKWQWLGIAKMAMAGAGGMQGRP